MAPLPKRRHSTRRGGKRKFAIRLKTQSLSKCPQCGAWRLPHRACMQCGYYGGKEVIKIKSKANKKK